jgi:hypothetical protein
MQLPEHILPEELRIKVQTFLRTPTAELMQKYIQPWEDCKANAMIDCLNETDDQEQLTKIHEFLEKSFSFQGYMLVGTRLRTWTADVVEDEEEVETDRFISLHLNR